MRHPNRHTAPRIEHASSVIVPFPVPKSEVGLVRALRAGHVDAVRTLFDRHSAHLMRVAACVLGPDASLPLVVSEAVQCSLGTLDQLRDPAALRSWLVSGLIVATRRRLKARRRWRWLGLNKRSDLLCDGQQWSERLLASYRILDCLRDEQRIVFCLVVIHSMGLTEAATVLGVSMSQIRIALEKACESFEQHCRREPALATRRLRSA